MKIKNISSRNNPTFKNLLKLLSGKGIKKQDLALLSGPKQVSEVREEFPDKCTGILFTADMAFSDRGLDRDLQAYLLESDLFRELDLHGTDSPILIVSAGPFAPWDEKQWPPGCTLLVPFQDPANVGAVVRSGAAFGVSRIVLLQEAAHPFHPKAMRVAGSNLFRVPMFIGPSLSDLREEAAPLITLSPLGKDIGRYRFPEVFGLIPGMEGPGIPSALRRMESLSIPMEQGVESLNAAMAAGIALHVWRSGRSPHGVGP